MTKIKISDKCKDLGFQGEQDCETAHEREHPPVVVQVQEELCTLVKASLCCNMSDEKWKMSSNASQIRSICLHTTLVKILVSKNSLVSHRTVFQRLLKT